MSENTPTIPDEQEIERLLSSLHPGLSARFYRRLAHAPWTSGPGAGPDREAQPGARMGPGGRRARTLGLAMAGLLLAAALLALTPGGRAVAGEVLGFFTRAGRRAFPLPQAELTALAGDAQTTSAGTYRLALEAVRAGGPAAAASPTTAAAGAPPASPTTGECPADPTEGYRCQVAAAEANAGFGALEFPTLPRGFQFAGVQWISGVQAALQISYEAIGGGGELALSQGLGEYPPASEWAAVPDEAIQAVEVAGRPGEWAQGMFVVMAGAQEAAWQADAPVQRLRWRVGERWLELTKYGDPVPIEWLDQEALIALAGSLVDQAADRPGELNPERLERVEDAGRLAGFAVREPGLLPEGFAFAYAQWDATGPFVKLIYTPGGESSAAGLLIFQSPAVNGTADAPAVADFPPGAAQVVAVGPATGFYVAGSWWAAPAPKGTPTPGPTPTLTWRADDPTRSLVWEMDGLSIHILFFASPDYGGRLELPEMVQIAESMR